MICLFYYKVYEKCSVTNNSQIHLFLKMISRGPCSTPETFGMWYRVVFGTKWHRFHYCCNLWWVQHIYCINTLDYKESDDNMFNPILKENVPGRKYPTSCAFAEQDLFNHLFRRRSKKTSKLRVTGLCEGNPSITSGLPSQRPSDVENASIWRCHHGPLARYVKLQVAHAPGMLGTFSPAADFKGNC